jgi:hypothetical protein
MIFLNPAVLLGLLAASLPIVIHLINFQKRREVEFSSLKLIKQLETSAIKNFRLREWLLLLIRSLIIFFIVFSFSKPIFPGYLAGSGFSTQTRTSALVLLDDSPSMNYRDAFGNDTWKQAKRAALRVLDYFSESDEILLAFTSDPSATESMSVADARKKIAQAEPHAFGELTETVIRNGLQTLANARHLNRELYVISDFHPSGFFSGDTTHIALLSEKLSLYMIGVSPTPRENTGLVSADVRTKIFEPQKAVQVQVAATSNRNKPATLKLFFDDKLAAESSIEFAANSGMGEQTLSAVPSTTGFISGVAAIEADNLTLDDKHFFTFYIPEKLRLLLAYSSERDAEFLKIALQSFYQGKFFELTLISESALDGKEFSNFDALIFCGLKQVSPAVIQKTESFVRQGGGLIFFAPSSQSVAQNFSSHNALLGKLGAGELRAAKRGVAMPIDRLELAHPIFDGVFSSKEKMKSLLSEQNAGGELYDAAEYLASPRETALMMYQRTKPAMTLSKFQNGSVIVFNAMPVPEAANFVLQPLFAPLLYRALFYASAKSQQETRTITIGEEQALALPPGLGAASELMVVKPSGKTLALPVKRKLTGVELRLSPAEIDETGIYSVRRRVGAEAQVGNQTGNQIEKSSTEKLPSEKSLTGKPADELLRFAVNLSPRESESVILSGDALVKRLVGKGVAGSQIFFCDASRSADAAGDMISGSRYGLGIWKYLVAFAALLVIAESVLGRKSDV